MTIAKRARTGHALLWVALMLPFFLSVIGLAIDGGLAFNARRELQNVADGAARAGAMQIDLGTYRATSGTTIVLDPGRARAAADAYLAESGLPFLAAVESDVERVVVHVQTEVPTAFLRVVGIRQVRISATAPAEVRYGIGSASE
jgi:Flp pilus assembly protein TadG